MIGYVVLGILAVVILLVVIAAVSWYRVVATGEAHVVVTPKGKFVVSADENIATEGKKSYFAIPSYLPFIGRTVKTIDTTVQELIGPLMTWEKSLARYNVNTSTKYRVNDAIKAASSYKDEKTLKEQLKEVVESSVR